jgi:hypothetical protein
MVDSNSNARIKKAKQICPNQGCSGVIRINVDRGVYECSQHPNWHFKKIPACKARKLARKEAG